MAKIHGISHLLQDLHDLYYKVCAIDLRNRMSLYHHNNVTKAAPDISTSLKKHFDKLSQTSKPNMAGTARTTKPISTKRAARRSYNRKWSNRQPKGITGMVNAFLRPRKIFSRTISTDQNMGEKLKHSTWSHIHTATLQARQGNLSNAKMHARIANDALKEAAHFMSEDDYKDFCNEVAKAFEELAG